MTIAMNLLSVLAMTVLTQTTPLPGEEALVTPVKEEPPAVKAETTIASDVVAELRAPRTIIPVGREVFVEFVIRNLTDQPVKLAVPDALEGKPRPDYGMGLPLEHVFSGPGFKGLEVASEYNPRMGDRVTRKPEYPVPSITLTPFGSVGLRFDVARFYPGLHQAGIYQLEWHPYNGTLTAEPLVIKVVEMKQVVMETDYGTLSMNLLYDQAPEHVENFLELVEKRFYNGLTFHRVHPGQFLLGGCPEGNGSGKRPDGVCLAPEFNKTPFDLGTVGMALVESDVNSGSCQFFICLGRQPGWDGRYTAFAQITGPESLETLRKLGAVEVDEHSRPVKPLRIKSMTAVEAVYLPSQMLR